MSPSQWLGKQSYLDDLASLDGELYQGLIFLKHYSGDLADLALNFTVTQDEFGIARSVELTPNGSNIPVTKENRLRYIYLVSLYKLSRQIRKQSDAFFDGLSEMIDPKWLRYVPSIFAPLSPPSPLPLLAFPHFRTKRYAYLTIRDFVECSINKSSKFSSVEWILRSTWTTSERIRSMEGCTPMTNRRSKHFGESSSLSPRIKRERC